MCGHWSRAILWAVGVAVASVAQAQPPWITQHRRGDVVVATVKKVSAQEATNATPPTIELEIHEVLRGDAKLDRTAAVWKPLPMDLGLCGVGVDFKKVTKDWEAKKLIAPKVGDKFVLWGELTDDKKRPVFAAFSWEAYPFSDEKRAWATKLVRDLAEEARLQQEKLTAEKKAKANALTGWRAKVSADDLKRYATEADVVLVGRICSSSETLQEVTPTFHARVLKGERLPKALSAEFNERFYLGLSTVLGPKCVPAGDKIYADVALPRGEWVQHLDRDTDYLVFLTLDGAKPQTVTVRYQPISSGDGIVIADLKAVEAVAAALGKK